MLDETTPTAALGAPIGGVEAVAAAVDDTLSKTLQVRTALLDIDHAPTETVLTRFCGDVSKLTYHLRLNGDRIATEQLDRHDQSMRASLDAIVGGGLTDEAWQVATLSVKDCGGLGMREARTLAGSAFVASRIAARPHVRTLASHLVEAGIGNIDVVMSHYDKRTEAALVEIVNRLDREAGLTLANELEQAAERAQECWETLFEQGDGETASDASDRRPRRPGAGVGLLPNDEDEDEEHPDNSRSISAIKLQKLIYKHVDRRKVGEITQGMTDRLDAGALRRMADLAHPECDHSWLWALNKHRGPAMDAATYTDALRVRLGVAGPAAPLPCELCGQSLLDAAGSHALCCAKAESTRGHHGVSRTIFGMATQVDPAAEMEAPGLIPGTLLRPADVLTGALGVGLTAIDIGIASPDAQHAGDDCLEAMYTRKVSHYEDHREALDRQNITYEPMLFSCYGRPHARATTLLCTLAKRIARRRGCSAGEWDYKRLRAAVGVEIWRRAAAMVQACWPGGGAQRDGDENE